MIHLVGHGMVGYMICSNCVMDTSDSRIQFDANGVCDHCRGFTQHVLPHWHPDEKGRQLFAQVVEDVRRTGKGREFDCILGMLTLLSGASRPGSTSSSRSRSRSTRRALTGSSDWQIRLSDLPADA